MIKLLPKQEKNKTTTLFRLLFYPHYLHCKCVATILLRVLPTISWMVGGPKEHLSTNTKWLQEMCVWHSTPYWGLKPTLISDSLSNIHLITSDFSQHAPRQCLNWSIKQRQVHVLLRWLRLRGMGQRAAGWESLCAITQSSALDLHSDCSL